MQGESAAYRLSDGPLYAAGAEQVAAGLVEISDQASELSLVGAAIAPAMRITRITQYPSADAILQEEEEEEQ